MSLIRRTLNHKNKRKKFNEGFPLCTAACPERSRRVSFVVHAFLRDRQRLPFPCRIFACRRFWLIRCSCCGLGLLISPSFRNSHRERSYSCNYAHTFSHRNCPPRIENV